MCRLIEAQTMHGMLERASNLIIHADISAHETSLFQTALINAPN
jgi:hypothetical protein